MVDGCNRWVAFGVTHLSVLNTRRNEMILKVFTRFLYGYIAIWSVVLFWIEFGTGR